MRGTWERWESSLWQTSAVMVVRGRDVVLVDPGITPEEVAAIAAAVAHRGLRVGAVVVTHPDWDHLIGVGAFPEAQALMSAHAAEEVARGAAAGALAAECARRGLGAPLGELRCDAVLEPGEVALGVLRAEAIELPGHAHGSLGLRLRDPDLLLVGDYLSPVEPPWIGASAPDYERTLRMLARLLESDPPESVIPGHGSPLSAEEAHDIAMADLDYLSRVRSAVATAVARGLGDDEAIAVGAAVRPPRPSPPDLAAALQGDNARYALAEARAGTMRGSGA